MVPTSKPPVEAWGTAVCASVKLTDRNMRRCTAEPSELSRICHCVPDPACAWPFVAASVIACLTAVPSRPSASTLTSCLTEAPGRIGVGSIVCVTPSANLPKQAEERSPAAASIARRRFTSPHCGPPRATTASADGAKPSQYGRRLPANLRVLRVGQPGGRIKDRGAGLAREEESAAVQSLG